MENKAELKLDLGLFGGVFAVPNAIADEHIKIASGAQLKALLYCLRHSGQSLTAGEISRAVGIPEADVADAIAFWRERTATLSGAVPLGQLSFEVALDAPATAPARLDVKAASALLSRDYEFKPTEITALIEEDKDVAYLFERAEALYGEKLKPVIHKALAVIVAEVGIDAMVALVLLEFCFTIGKTHASYIKKVAKDWYELNIITYEQAKEHAALLERYFTQEAEFVRKINNPAVCRAVPDKYKPFLNKWLLEFRFDMNVIYDGYQKSLEVTGGLNWKFLDEVMLTWHKFGIGKEDPNKKSKYAAKAKPSAKPKTTDSADPSSFDLNKLEQQILQKQHKRTQDALQKAKEQKSNEV
ncbi:MAG: DnaD domain protein [Oscillospiraceae bacterium]|nr:DnaD domain protein [Oscillospiraceae bacterium]